MNAILLDGRAVSPSKVVCIGRNYVEHIHELENEAPAEPVIFLKPNSAIADEVYSHHDEVIHYEGEISFVVMDGKLRGVGFGLDLTKRELQSRLKAKGLPWERAKAFDGSAVFSPFVSFDGMLQDLRMELYINNELTQHGGCHLMMNTPTKLLREAQSFLSFEDGDILMTGTPKGVGPLQAGATFSGKIFEKDRLLIEASWVVK